MLDNVVPSVACMGGVKDATVLPGEFWLEFRLLCGRGMVSDRLRLTRSPGVVFGGVRRSPGSGSFLEVTVEEE